MDIEKIEILRKRMLKLFMKPSYAANLNHIRKIESQIRYLERFNIVLEEK